VPSYSPVYSQPFIIYTSETPNREFLVPAGFTAVVRHVEYFVEIGDVNAWMILGADGAGFGSIFAAATDLSIFQSWPWSGHIAAPEGYLLTMTAEGIDDTFTGYCGGYLLRNNLT
jgi:hypothetical protein